MMKFRRLAAVLGLAAVASAAQAQTSGNININVTVAAACTIAVNPLAFGTYSSLSATALRVSTTIDVACVQGSTASVSLGNGNNVSTAQRRMANGAASSYLNYALYKPASSAAGAACAYTASWGNGGAVGTVFTTTASTDLTPRTYNVCGEIPAGQNVPADGYSDIVAATVTF